MRLHITGVRCLRYPISFSRVVDLVESGPFWSDPENFHQIRIWIRILSVPYLGYFKIYKQGKNVLKIELNLDV